MTQLTKSIKFFKAGTPDERKAINLFLLRHNSRGAGSKTGYVAYFAASFPPDGRPLLERIVAAAKICPLHTPQAARFYGGSDWRQVYVLQRLAAVFWKHSLSEAPENLLSQFLGWCLKEVGRDPKVWYVATYADPNTFDSRTGRPNDGGIYRATNAIYCGQTAGNRVEGYILNGERRSMRCGPKTLRIGDIPRQARIIRGAPKHRYCWAVGPPLRRSFRRRVLEKRMRRFRFVAAYQPRLLARLLANITAEFKRKVLLWLD